MTPVEQVKARFDALAAEAKAIGELTRSLDFTTSESAMLHDTMLTVDGAAQEIGRVLEMVDMRTRNRSV